MRKRQKDVYLDFCNGTLKYEDFPRRYGYGWFCCAIDHIWEVIPGTIDWFDMERFMRDVIESPYLDPGRKVRLIAEGLGAYTGRGVPVYRELEDV